VVSASWRLLQKAVDYNTAMSMGRFASTPDFPKIAFADEKKEKER
jgi:hypothetical protein